MQGDSVRYFLPRAFDVVYLRLHSEFALKTYFASNAGNLSRE
jgi:hypothetical protein